MEDIRIPIVQLTPQAFRLCVDLSIYASEAITAACYKFTHLYYVHQQKNPSSDNLIDVIFEPKESGAAVTELAVKQFCNELIDQQVRHNTNLQFGHIRDLIVEEAFKPVN